MCAAHSFHIFIHIDFRLKQDGGVQGQGGAHNCAKPTLDVGVLVLLFGQFSAAICDLGPYEFISRTQACHGRGLVALIDLLRAIVEICPGAELATGAAKQALLVLVVQRPEINTSKYNNGIWAGLRVERLATV